MKIKINRNILWTETFVNKLSNLGVKYACISPGSRNTPLTIAFANNKKIKSFILVDERSNGFFALGLARASDSPVVLVCTSGTAVAEFYPAIIEAYQQRIPLIVCTADRPPELIGKGANQTIFQDNIYKNHIRWFVNAGLPEPNSERLEFICRLAEKAVLDSSKDNRGPVHINFPFRKPFEPSSFTDEIEENLTDISNCLKTQIFRSSNQNFETVSSKENENIFEEIYSSCKSNARGLIVVGPGTYQDSFAEKVNILASMLNYPIIADGTSNLRFNHLPKTNIFSNFEGYFRSDSFMSTMKPELVIQFGRMCTSKAMEEFFGNMDAPFFIIDEYGQWFDPFNKARAVLKMKPESFCANIVSRLKHNGFVSQTESSWLDKFTKAELLAEELKNEIIEEAQFPFEGRIITEVIKLIPENSALMISNSMPVRDLDYFAQKVSKHIQIFHNRGASGIDGITSTALGLSFALSKKTVLITGDLAFYYDLNGLLASLKYSIPLTVVLVNNNGGGIFQMLPIAKCEEIFEDYFSTPLNIDFSHFVKAYNGNFEVVSSWEHFRMAFSNSLNINEGISVIQVNTDPKASSLIRKDYWKRVGELV
jgi:2-succinyl-5-enolpyruvyl-6-hydroxy-3-cyclohexene-1-carboxylate synthase